MVDLALAAVPDFSIPIIENGAKMSKLQLQAALNDARNQMADSNATCENLVKYMNGAD